MTRDYDEQPDNASEQQADHDTNPFDRSKRPQPVFSDFEEDDNLPYEEPDRDTDYASGFREDRLEDDEFDDYPQDSQEDDSPSFHSGEPGGFEPEHASGLQQTPLSAAEMNETWLGEEEYAVEDASGSAQSWPLGLIAVGVIALVLLVAGGYGVIQQRSETREEILQLQAALATAASPEDVNASRAAVRDLKRENARLASQGDALRTENRRLLDTVAGLEAQLDAQRAGKGSVAAEPAAAQPKAAPAKPAAAQPKAAPAKPAAQPKRSEPVAAKPVPATAQAATIAAGANWFVNFGSYGQRAAAETWQAKLKPGAGTVIIAPILKDGKTFYRVRVINLTNRESADKVARSLEQEFGLSKLWVGKQ